jgi:hypothetical protein
MNGLIPLYSKFIRALRINRKEIARLQALGRLEEYFTKRFALTIYRESQFTILPLTNLGDRDEPKIDVVLLEGDLSKSVLKQGAYKKDARVRGFIELKYLRNRHRIGSRAEDEITTVLKDLKRQLSVVCNMPKHAGYRVALRSRRKDIYGVVFASYLRASDEEDGEAQFTQRILKCARDQGFWWHDYERPYLRPIYTAEKIMILNRQFYASLYHGIWRLGGHS